MFDLGTMELLVVAVLALVVVGPKELPRLLRAAGGLMRKGRRLTADFRRALDDLADEVEREADPFREERDREGLKPGMDPFEITEHIMSRKEGRNGDVPVGANDDGVVLANEDGSPGGTDGDGGEGRS
ncbi:Sec-independent protein translocase protein TatB [Yunchengibacter salinarum]|uniref:Sec-independent protein translocase protein TatB n=1 Tax=Yunchengibacter salinarum TaxID=3133399 RepID=UPI0035B66250